MSVQRRAFGGAAGLVLVVDLIRAMPMASRHVVDFPWRLTAPDVANGRDAVCWQDADGRIVGLAAWQQVWATLDYYIRPGPDAAAVERAVFAWAGERFRERDAERGYPQPYSVEFRGDDQGRQALTAAHGFVNDRHAVNIHFERVLRRCLRQWRPRPGSSSGHWPASPRRRPTPRSTGPRSAGRR